MVYRRSFAWIVIFLIVIFWIFAFRIHAQELDLQNRDAFHMQAGIGRGFGAAFWVVGNVKTETPRNTNLFFGVFRGDKDNWLEVMAQKQWNNKGGFWALDVRYKAQLTKRLSVFVEPTAFVTQPGFYHFVAVEYRTWKRLSLGGETENIHRPEGQPQQLNFGPRASVKFGSKWGVDYGAAVAYRFSLTGPNELRAYASASRRFSLRRGRK